MLERRLLKLEEERNQASLSKEEVDTRLNELLAKAGTTEAEVIAEYGSLQAFERWLTRNGGVKQSRSSSTGDPDGKDQPGQVGL